MTLDEQEFQRRTQQIALGLQNVVTKINTLRQNARSRAQLLREVVVRPTADGWRETRPYPVASGILRGPPQSEEAQKVIKQAEPSPLRWVTFESYGEDPPQRIEERAPVYIDDESGGTIGVLKLVLEEARGNFNEMKQLSQQHEPALAELQEFDIDEELSSRLEESPPEFAITRENFYELLPPAPINPSPGLSVFHKFDVRSLTYVREDLAGRLGSPTATPIPLWFIGVTLWWG